MEKRFAVIGLGVFGMHVAMNLKRLGQEVLAIDLDREQIAAAADELDAVVRADATDERALRELQLDKVSCAVVAIGAGSVESSILATTVLRQIGVPQIVARSLSTLHARALRAVGAHAVVHPEAEMGERLALRLVQPGVLDRLGLGANAELAEIEVPAEFVGRTLVELNVRRRHGVTVVAVRRGETVLANLDASETLRTGDILIVIGSPDAVGRVAARS